MSRFFMRFNLQNSVSSFPATKDVFAPILPSMSEDEIKMTLEDFERIRIERAQRVSAECKDAIEKIKGKSVLFLGDSITSDNLGYRLTVTKCASLKAYDCSVSGGLSSMLTYVTKDFTSKLKPDIVSLMVGTNDSIGMESIDNPQTSLEEFGRNIDLILKWVTKSGAKVVLFEIPPVHEQRFSNCFNPNSKFQNNENIKKFNAMLKKVANVYGVNVISNDCYLQNADENYEIDGAHLSVKAHEIHAKRWIQETAKLF